MPTDEQLPQRELVKVVRGQVDALQAAVTAAEWSRHARRLRQLLQANEEGMNAAFVRHNIGTRGAFLHRFAEAQGFAFRWPL